jgi:hypothetical protein
LTLQKVDSKLYTIRRVFEGDISLFLSELKNGDSCSFIEMSGLRVTEVELVMFDYFAGIFEAWTR